MYKVANRSVKELEELFSATAAKVGIYELVCCQMFERICILGPKGNGL